MSNLSTDGEIEDDRPGIAPTWKPRTDAEWRNLVRRWKKKLEEVIEDMQVDLGATQVHPDPGL